MQRPMAQCTGLCMWGSVCYLLQLSLIFPFGVGDGIISSGVFERSLGALIPRNRDSTARCDSNSSTCFRPLVSVQMVKTEITGYEGPALRDSEKFPDCQYHMQAPGN